MQNRNKLKKLINNAFSSLYKLRNIGSKDYIEELYQVSKKEEKQHRNWINGFYDNHNKPESINTIAKMFTVKNIAESLLKENLYSVKDIIRIKESCILSQSIVENYQDIALDCFKNFDLNELSNLDYCELVN